MPSVNPLLCKQAEVGFVPSSVQICPLWDRMAVFFPCCVCVFMWLCICVSPAEWKSGRDKVSLLDGGEEGRLSVFRWCVHQWTEMKHIYLERRWSEWRDTALGTCSNTPHSISTQKVRPQTQFFQCNSIFVCVKDVCSFVEAFVDLFIYPPGLSTKHHGSCHLHPGHPVQDARWERWILQHPEQRWVPKPGDLWATQLCQGKSQELFLDTLYLLRLCLLITFS